MLKMFGHISRIAILAGVLTGCSALSTVEMAARPLAAYDLPSLQPTPSSQTPSGHMLIDRPESSGAIATDRIMVKPSPLEVQYLPDVKWVEDAPRLFQRLIVESVAASEAFSLVASRDFGPNPDFVMVGDLIAFQAEIDEGGASAHIRATLTLVRDRDRRILATRTFEEVVSARSDAPVDIVGAFEAASRNVLHDVVVWTTSVLR